MKTHLRPTLFLMVLAVLMIASCMPAAKPAPLPKATSASVPDLYSAQSRENAAPPAAQSGGIAMDNVTNGLQAATSAPAEGQASAQPVATLPADIPLGGSSPANHMIIKNAELKLLVHDTDIAIDLTTQVAGDLGGYIISSREWYQDANGKNYKFATLTLGIPGSQFETAMRRLRDMAMGVLDENASGQDVTSEYVDLQSQLVNLQATRDRIRSFLDNAQTVEESLQINQQLTAIEGQIEQVKGRMNFLSNRTAYSTITVNLQPDIPALTPTPTPTLLPTPTPVIWNPGNTLNQATSEVTGIYQGFVDIAIWLFVVIIPLIGPPALIVWGIYKLVTRKTRKNEPKP